MGDFFESLFIILAILSSVYMLIVSISYIVLFLFATPKIYREATLNRELYHEDLTDNKRAYPVSVLVPSYNEEVGILSTIRSLLAVRYPEYEIIIIDDGSKDQTSHKVKQAYKMVEVKPAIRKHMETEPIKAVYQSTIYEYMYLIEKENGGKADALNAGINMSRYPYYCVIDADCVLETDALLKTMKPIMESNGQVVVTGGSIGIANGSQITYGEVQTIDLPKQSIVIMQIVEYLRAFLIGRLGLSRLNILLIISGAYGVFNKELVIRAGGYEVKTVGEDMELIVRIHRLLKEEKSSKRISYIPNPVCWTEAPSTIGSLFKQRVRWQRGLLETLYLHKKMMFRPKYQSIGLFSLPYFLFVELLGVLFEAISYTLMIIGLFTNLIDIKIVLLMFCVTILYGSLMSSFAIILEEVSFQKYPKPRHLIKLYLAALTESFWYRPLLIIARMKGLFTVFHKSRNWGDMDRKGISQDHSLNKEQILNEQKHKPPIEEIEG